MSKSGDHWVGGNTNVLNSTIIAIMAKKSTSGRQEEKVLAGIDDVFQEKYFHLFLNRKTNTDFEIIVPQNNEGVYNSLIGDVYISIRKNDRYLPFKIELVRDVNGPIFDWVQGGVFSYGYCYKR
jgi:hypothetical protein